MKKLFKSLFLILACGLYLSSCNSIDNENNVEVEIFLPYLSEDKVNPSKTISSPDSGTSFDFVAEFTHSGSIENFKLQGKSGDILKTGRIRAGVWGITLNAYSNEELCYSASTKTTLKAHESKTLAFSFSKAAEQNNSDSDSSDTTDPSDDSNLDNDEENLQSTSPFVSPTTKISSNISFTVESSIRADTTTMNIDLSEVESKYLENAVIALYDSNNNCITSKAIPSEISTSDNKVVDLKVSFTTSGTYTLSIFQGTRRIQVSKTITVYPVTSISKIYIPDAALSYAGNNLPVIITGENFKSADFDASKLVFSGDAEIDGDYTVVSNSRITCNIKCPESSGTKTITATYDEKYIVTTQIKIIPDEKCIYTPGDLILKDGSRIAYEDISTLTESQKENAMAIIGATLYGGGTVLGAAINLSDLIPFQKTATNETKADITVTPAFDRNYKLTSINSMDSGINNLDYITQIDSNAVSNLSEYYPVFNYAETYGNTNLFEGYYENGWYIPSVYELYEILLNFSSLNKVRTILGLETIQYTDYYHYTNMDSSGISYYEFNYLYSSSYYDATKINVVYLYDKGEKKREADVYPECHTFDSVAKSTDAKYGSYKYSVGTISLKSATVRSSTNSYDHTVTCYYNSGKYSFYPRAMPVHLIPIN